MYLLSCLDCLKSMAMELYSLVSGASVLDLYLFPLQVLELPEQINYSVTN